MPVFYRLDDDNRVVALPALDSYDAVGRRLRKIAVEVIGDIVVSTIFTGIDHAGPLHGTGPLVFETMVFDANDRCIEQRRYSLYDEAMAGHAALVEKYISGTEAGR